MLTVCANIFLILLFSLRTFLTFTSRSHLVRLGERGVHTMELQKPMQLSLIGWEKFLGDSTEVLQAVDTGGVFMSIQVYLFLEE